jgi:hypothetical protein
MTKKLLFLLAGMGLAAGTARAQAVVNAAGTTLSNEAYSHSFSIGEIATTTLAGPDGYLTQGYLQPHLLPEEGPFDYYPNPVVQDLVLINARRIDQVKFYDAAGRLVLTAPYAGKPLNLSVLSGAVYLVNAFSKGKLLHKFFIIKQ